MFRYGGMGRIKKEIEFSTETLKYCEKRKIEIDASNTQPSGEDRPKRRGRVNKPADGAPKAQRCEIRGGLTGKSDVRSTEGRCVEKARTET